MLRLTKSHASIPAALCAPTLLLSACGSSNSRYPAGWPPLSSKSSAGGCSDVTGKTCLTATTLITMRLRLVLSTFLGGGVTQVYAAPFESFAIAGDAATSLTITVTRAPSSPTIPGKAPETQTATALNGSAYTCDSAWLVGVPKNFRHDSPAQYVWRRGADLPLRHDGATDSALPAR